MGKVTILNFDPVFGLSAGGTLNLLAHPEGDQSELAAGLEDEIREALEFDK